MCDFVSWVELPNGKHRFLTREQLETQRGAELIEHVASREDLCGHGAIRWYYGIPDHMGANRECSWFRDKKFHPPEIVRAIETGLMEGIGRSIALLSSSAWGSFETTARMLSVKYESELQVAMSRYERGSHPEHETDRLRERVDRRTVAVGEYQSTRQRLKNERFLAEQVCFWALFAEPENRRESWR